MTGSASPNRERASAVVGTRSVQRRSTSRVSAPVPASRAAGAAPMGGGASKKKEAYAAPAKEAPAEAPPVESPGARRRSSLTLASQKKLAAAGALEDGDYETAAKCYSEAIELCPKDDSSLGIYYSSRARRGVRPRRGEPSPRAPSSQRRGAAGELLREPGETRRGRRGLRGGDQGDQVLPAGLAAARQVAPRPRGVRRGQGRVRVRAQARRHGRGVEGVPRRRPQGARRRPGGGDARRGGARRGDAGGGRRAGDELSGVVRAPRASRAAALVGGPSSRRRRRRTRRPARRRPWPRRRRPRPRPARRRRPARRARRAARAP